MTQLVLVKRRDDGDCEFITAIQNDADSVDIPALEWILQMKGSLESDDDSAVLEIFLRNEIPDVLQIGQDTDITEKCQTQFKAGNNFYE